MWRQRAIVGVALAAGLALLAWSWSRRKRVPVLNANCVERVRESCATLRCDSMARVDPDKAREFARQLNLDEVRTKGGELAAKGGLCDFSHLQFDSVASEAAFISLLHGLDFGSGFRQELHSACGGRGAWLTVRAGMSALYTVDPLLSSHRLAAVTNEQVCEWFQLPLQHEGRDTGLRPLVQMFGNVIREFGTALAARNFSTVADFVMTTLQNSPREQRAACMVKALVDTFPRTFNDAYVYRTDSQPVYLYKKAQLVVGELFHRFGREEPLFDFGDGPRLTAFVDNVIAATMRKTAVVWCCPELHRKIDSGENLPRGSEYEIALRAKSLTAVETIAKECGYAITPVQLGNYLWAILGKEPSFRSYPRHSTKDTCFY